VTAGPPAIAREAPPPIERTKHDKPGAIVIDVGINRVDGGLIS